MKKTIVVTWIMFTFIACKPIQNMTMMNQDKNPLKKTWILKKVLMGDALDAPCGFINEDKVNEMYITFSEENENGVIKFKFNGQSSVNSFIGSYTILSYDVKTNTGKIKINPILSTKKASENFSFNECENRFFKFLETSEEFKINGNKLELYKTTKLENNQETLSSYTIKLYFDKKSLLSDKNK
jgi:heat shock protein HslJ